MLTVYSVLWIGPDTKYTPDHVRRLRDQVAEHLPVEHRFVCITAEDVEGVECVAPAYDYPGWWSKLNLFSDRLPLGPKLYLDLDVAIVGDLSHWAGGSWHEHGAICSPANWAQSGHGGIQSSVMVWGGDFSQVCELFNPESARWPPVNKPGILWGDQEYLTLLRNTDKLDWFELPPQWVRSYKYHCRDGLPPDCRVCVFHGAPKPWEVTEPWLQ